MTAYFNVILPHAARAEAVDRARRYVRRHRWLTTRKGLLDACFTLANYGDTEDRILARELRNALWGSQASDLTPTGKALARLNRRRIVSDFWADVADDTASVVLITVAVLVFGLTLLCAFSPATFDAWVR